MITRAHFENFKCFRDADVDLDPLTVLVGKNGAGKTSLLHGLYLLAQAATPNDVGDRKIRFGRVFRGQADAKRLVRGFGSDPMHMVLEQEATDGDVCSLQVAVNFPPSNVLELGDAKDDGTSFRLSIRSPASKEAAIVVEAPSRELSASIHSGRDSRFAQFTSVVYLQLNPRAMSKTSISQDERPRLSRDGSGLASVLAWMKGAAEEKLNDITRDLATVVPGVKRIRTYRELVTDQDYETVAVDGQRLLKPTLKSLMGDRFEVEFANNVSVPSDLLSEGTLLALGLLTKLHDPGSQQSQLILLDDAERGLHLEAQHRLVEVVRKLMTLHEGLQVVFTTHSPYLLSEIAPSEVRVLALDEQRCAHIRKLTEHPDFEKWRYGTQTGELWAALGESWVTEESGTQAL
jgi:predicted ATPase